MIKLWGIPLRLHPLFTLIMLTSFLAGYFLEMLTLFIIVFVHEWGHVAAAKWFGLNIRSIKLLPFGGVAELEDADGIPVWQDLIISLAGPLQNVLMIGMAMLFREVGWWSAEWSNYFIQSNIIIALFNLLPITPLDGGRIIQSLLSLILPFYRVLLCTAVFGLVGSFAMGVYAFFHNGTEGVQLNLLVIALFLFMSNWQARKNIWYRFFRFLLSKVRNPHVSETGSRPLYVPGKTSLPDLLKMLRRAYSTEFVLLSPNGTVQGIVTEDRLIHLYMSGKHS